MPPVWIVLALLPILGGAERFNCRGRILGAYYADAKSGCKAFHVCVRVAGGGVRDFRFFCPPGTLFHQEAQTCTDWGDDDPLACPAEIYDGQFDLYKIGSGYDTKKISSSGNRDEEAEFGLQRAETGDRRLSQSQNNPSSGASDLRAAHSSDFFSGQRDRGRDDIASVPSQASSSSSRQSFRRASTPRPYSYSQTHSTAQYTTEVPPSQPSSPAQYDVTKRKLVRKRPIYVSTPAPTTTFSQNTQTTQLFSDQPQQQQQYHQPPQQRPQSTQQQYQRPTQKKYQQKQYQEPPQQQSSQELYQQNPQQQSKQLQLQQYQQKPKQQPKQPIKPQLPPQQESQQYNQNPQQPTRQIQQQQYQQQPQPQPPTQQRNNNFEYFNRRIVPQNKQTTQQTISPPSVPPQYKEYKDEYVEVSRVTPKQNRFFPSSPSPTPFTQTTPASFSKKEGLVELYNYESQSTQGFNVQKDNQPFKVKNSFSVSDNPIEIDFERTKKINNNKIRINPTTLDFNTATARTTTGSTPAFRNFNSVSYESEKNNLVSFSKQNYYNSPTAPPTTTLYTTTRPEPPANLNTVAYNTNIGFNIQSNFAHNDDDDGQYRPPEGEDDGQYKPELYDRELLSGAHSLNIAASGNRLPEDQKHRGKTQPPIKPTAQTAAPRPFRPAPTPSVPPTQTSRIPEPIFTTPSRSQTLNTQRTFDFYQTYTTTSRPTESPTPVHVPENIVPINNAPLRPSTTLATKAPDTRPPPPPTVQRVTPTTRPPYFANPASEKEDTSYDYAYYDSDPGFSEYDHIEEFGKTKVKA